jgi:hypothetical protein
MTNAEIRSNVFAQIDSIIENSNASNFKILGWTHIDIRLILYFRDCKQVYEWPYQSTKCSMKFFTKDYDNHDEYSAELKEFTKQMEIDKPEE